MCGIYCRLQGCVEHDFTHIKQQESDLNFYEHCTDNLLASRGPDFCRQHWIFGNPYWNIFCVGNVLCMQGKKPGTQPFVTEKRNLLLWNGEIYSGTLVPCDSYSDTAKLAKALDEAESDEDISNTLSSVRGPYSFIYLDMVHKHLWFGRDVLGRRSLLFTYSEKELLLTSVSKKTIPCSEVPAIGLFKVQLRSTELKDITLYPWLGLSNENIVAALETSNLVVSIGVSIDSPCSIFMPKYLGKPSSELNILLAEFAAKKSSDTFEKIMSCENFGTCVSNFINVLKQAVKVRVEVQNKLCKSCTFNEICKHGKIGVLFSGGIDSTVIAALAHQFIPLDEPIDLLNVSFEKTTVAHLAKTKVNSTNDSYMGPDRITAISSHKMLQSLFANRVWNLVQINVSREELEMKCKERISHLIHPLKTVLDESLGCALWFASCGKGKLMTSADKIVDYTSRAKVLLLGMGADEQLGGYMRHRNMLKRAGWQGLALGLYNDTSNIWFRNLGRDDRIVSDHGSEPRMPFLDEEVVNFLQQLEPWKKCFPVPELPPGVGDKILLRLAAWSIGLHDVAFFPKKALQFGSRIANPKENGRDISQNLL